MTRTALIIILLTAYAHTVVARGHYMIIIDSATNKPLSSATVFDKNGNVLGLSDAKGRTPYITQNDCPVTIRYLGFKESIVNAEIPDSVFMEWTYTEFPELVVESRQHKVLHILAYVREFSTLYTYTDTVHLFREKMVDYMLVPERKTKFKGWSTPRVLKSKSYYQFTNSHGLDSVSDKCNHHFSWSDWVGIVKPPTIPQRLRGSGTSDSDTIRGKYSAAEIWTKNDDRFIVDVNVLADTASHKWVPNLANFFRNHLDFEDFRVRFNYENVIGDSISPQDLTGYTFKIESNGRGHDMFRFHKIEEQFYVTTYAEIYVTDKEYITVKEAKKWDRRQFDTNAIDIIEPAEVPELQPSVLKLIARVEAIDHDGVRQTLEPDFSHMSKHYGKPNHNFSLGYRALGFLKDILGISSIISRKNNKKNWSDFRRGQISKNQNKRVDNGQEAD